MATKKVLKAVKSKKWKPNPAIKKLRTVDDVKKFVKSKQFTEKDYEDFWSDKDAYADTPYVLNHYNDVDRIILNSKFNKPTVNDKIINNLYDQLKKTGKNQEIDDVVYKIKNLVKKSKLGAKTMNFLTTNPDSFLLNIHGEAHEPVMAITLNPNFKTEHLYKMVQSFPNEVKVNRLINHSLADDRVADIVLSDKDRADSLYSSDLDSYIYRHMDRETGESTINPRHKLAILNNASHKIPQGSFMKLLGSLDPHLRNNYIDEKLGIKGGKPNYTADTDFRTDEPKPEDLKWDNWVKGPDYNQSAADYLAESPYLNDEQADHIKRHGDFSEKIRLYHNKEVDPRHGIEMFNKWKNDEDEHGYSSEQLNEYNQRHNSDKYSLEDVPEGFFDDEEESIYDNAREGADQDYDFGRWVDDNEDEALNLLSDDAFGDEFMDKVSEKLHSEHEWEGENPNSKQNIGNPEFDALDKLHESFVNTDDDFDKDDFQWVMNRFNLKFKDPKELGLEADENGRVDLDNVKEKLNEFGGPSTIDYANSDDHTIHDHPEYADRESDAVAEAKQEMLRDRPYDFYDDLYEHYYESDEYQNAIEENEKYQKEELAREWFKENKWPYAHTDLRFIPEHLLDHIPGMDEIKAQRKKAQADGQHGGFLNQFIPDREHEHQYGSGQQQLELLKDYADAKGGDIDQGIMHKIFPNLKDTWKKIFNNKGKISSQEIEEKIKSIPKTNYDITYGKWKGSNMQNLNNRDQVVVRLDHSDESLTPLKKDPDLYNTFQKVQDVSRRSGHPTNKNTIAWARVDMTDPKHWMVDEVQSDFGSTVTRYLKEQGAEEKAKHINQIADYHKDWREALLNHVLNLAKKHDVNKVSTHSPDSKSAHTGSGMTHSVYNDSYKKVPRRMGFKPSKGEELPITDKTKGEVFKKVNSDTLKELLWNHTSAAKHHNEMFNNLSLLANSKHGKKYPEQINNLSKIHDKMAKLHEERAIKYSTLSNPKESFDLKHFRPEPSDKQEALSAGLVAVKAGKPTPHEYDKHLNKPALEDKNEMHEGHTYDLKPQIKKSEIDLAISLIKGEEKFVNFISQGIVPQNVLNEIKIVRRKLQCS